MKANYFEKQAKNKKNMGADRTHCRNIRKHKIGVCFGQVMSLPWFHMIQEIFSTGLFNAQLDEHILLSNDILEGMIHQATSV